MATEKNVALVLSSGGARGLAHIGAIEQLQRRGYTIRSVVGGSMGALVGGMFATGKIKRNASRSLARRIVDAVLPSVNDINFVSLMSRMSSIMIQQNALMAIRLYKPDILITMPMNRFSSFDYDKMDKIVAIGNSKMEKALSDFSAKRPAALPFQNKADGKR